MEIRHGRQRRPNKICGVGFKVRPLPADTVEELAAEGEIGYEVYYAWS
jgi:hypothetical protein